ncbi:MAG: glycosyltransferase [Chloroflexi bacterium]|nr:glycosyltransferase [Chloroflexota bacterium]MBI3742602.1 glycosyltransferase [Chloroflexota bacterium]
MTDLRELFLESALKLDGQRRVAEIGAADMVIGIPTHKNASALARVLDAASQGVQKYFPSLRAIIAVMDGGSSDETLQIAATHPLASNVRRLIATYHGIPGKGSAVRAIFEIARSVNARAVIVLESDLASIEPQWISKFVAPILNDGFDLAIPTYWQPLVEGGISDLLAYPLMHALYASDVRTPMPGEFAISGALAARLYERDVWETDVARHGLDIWLTTVAVNENIRACQLRLGTKIHDARQVAALVDPAFVQAVGTLFRMMEVYRRRWVMINPPNAFPFFGDGATSNAARLGGQITQERLIEAFQAGAKRYRRFWRAIVAPTHYTHVFELANRTTGAINFPADLWARIVFDFAVVYNKGETDPDKVASALLPLYYARLATLLHETHSRLDAMENAIHAQAKIFAAQKPYLIQRWDRFVPWAGEGVR